MRAKPFTTEQLAQAREIPLEELLDLLDLYYTQDRDYRPTGNAHSKRLNVSVGQDVVELIVTGDKWYDTRSAVGGGGAIDLVQHLFKIPFLKAVKKILHVRNY